MSDSPSRRHLNWPSAGPGRVLIVGDVHGEYDLLQRLLKLAEFSPNQDFVFALGDLIDRGPDSWAVLDWFSKPGQRASLMGNHEAMMLDAADDWHSRLLWYRNGGEWANSLSSETEELCRGMINRMPITAEVTFDSGLRVGLVHAEVHPGTAWAPLKNARADSAAAKSKSQADDSSSALWGRSRFVADMLLRSEDPKARAADRAESLWRDTQPVKGIDLVISGHSVIPDYVPRGRGNVLWIDTGAGYRGRLTAVDPLTWTYWQVGRGGETWGPLRLPDLAPVPPTLRPTRRQFKEAAASKARIEE